MQKYKILTCFVSVDGPKALVYKTCSNFMVFILIFIKNFCNKMLYMIFHHDIAIIFRFWRHTGKDIFKAIYFLTGVLVLTNLKKQFYIWYLSLVLMSEQGRFYFKEFRVDFHIFIQGYSQLSKITIPPLANPLPSSWTIELANKWGPY